MRPRFSILTLLGITALVAVAAASIAQPFGIWPYVCLYLIVITPMCLFPFAAGRKRLEALNAKLGGERPQAFSEGLVYRPEESAHDRL